MMAYPTFIIHWFPQQQDFQEWYKNKIIEVEKLKEVIQKRPYSVKQLYHLP